MATHIGNEGAVYIGANEVAEVVDFSYTERKAVADDSALADAADTHLGGSTNWDASITCQWEETDTNGQEALTIGASVTLNLYVEGASGGDDKASGTATVVEIGVAVRRNQTTQRTYRLTGNGALTHSTV